MNLHTAPAMTNRLVIVLSIAVLLPSLAFGQGNSWNKVRYNGGTIATKTDPDDWKNRLTVTSNEIRLELKDGQRVVIDPLKVSSISYGQEAHRRVGTMVALGILIAPVALFGLFHKTKKHYIGMDYEAADGKKAGILLQGDKNNFRAILLALSSATGQPVAVDPKDRKEVPANVSVSEVAAAANSRAPTQPAAQATSPTTGTIKLESDPPGAEIFVDGSFVGNTPAQLKLAAGKHAVRVAAAGHAEKTRELEVLGGSEVALTASLPKATSPTTSPEPETSSQPPQPRGNRCPPSTSWKPRQRLKPPRQ
jgi:hypothetical protein